jgi:hypothetical protein
LDDRFWIEEQKSEVATATAARDDGAFGTDEASPHRGQRYRISSADAAALRQDRRPTGRAARAV